jgi:hypothetical protein
MAHYLLRQCDKVFINRGARMHKILTAILCMTILVVGGISLGMAGDDATSSNEETMCIPLGVLSLEPPDSVEAIRSPVAFPHALHFNFACMECHHQWTAEEEPIQSCGTSGCHELDVPPEPDSGDDAILYYKNAFHNLCIGCHREIKTLNKKVAMTMGSSEKQVKSTGPTGCIQCHPK